MESLARISHTYIVKIVNLRLDVNVAKESVQ